MGRQWLKFLVNIYRLGVFESNHLIHYVGLSSCSMLAVRKLVANGGVKPSAIV
jgi:hypothetical protein